MVVRTHRNEIYFYVNYGLCSKLNGLLPLANNLLLLQEEKAGGVVSISAVLCGSG